MKPSRSRTSRSHTPTKSINAGTGPPINARNEATSNDAPSNSTAGTSALAHSLPMITKEVPRELTTHITSDPTLFITRILKTWPAMIGHGYRSPPFIHHMQMDICPSETLLNCACHLKLWYEEVADRAVLRRAVRLEMETIAKKMGQYNEDEIICAGQAYVLYSILFLFGDSTARNHSEDQLVILKLQDLTLDLAATGLLLEAEKNLRMPAWHEWVLMAAKRRTVLVSHEICWAWSVINGYPQFQCREIGFMQTVESKALWQASGEGEFQQSYTSWLAKWADGPHTMQELMLIHPKGELPERTERWLEDVDELGMMLMSQVNAV